MADNNKQATADEKRRFFRIEDLVHLTVNVLDERTFNEKIELLDKGVSEQFLVMSDLAAISTELASSLRRIESRDPEIADYLKGLDRKIDLLGRAIMSEEFGVSIDSAVPVNLSASGVGIMTGRTIPSDSNVEIRMILLPDHVGVIAYGNVVDCVEREDDRYQYLVRVDFTHIRDEDRDILIRHIMRKQGEMLRERRIARENAEN